MKIKISEATKPQLNWLVAKCEGFKNIRIQQLDHLQVFVATGALSFAFDPTGDYLNGWAQGGPIIEREKIGVNHEKVWMANVGFDPETGESEADESGPTSLIAAMRCYVASKLGDEVEVPDELA